MADELPEPDASSLDYRAGHRDGWEVGFHAGVQNAVSSLKALAVLRPDDAEVLNAAADALQRFEDDTEMKSLGLNPETEDEDLIAEAERLLRDDNGDS